MSYAQFFWGIFITITVISKIILFMLIEGLYMKFIFCRLLLSKRNYFVNVSFVWIYSNFEAPVWKDVLDTKRKLRQFLTWLSEKRRKNSNCQGSKLDKNKVVNIFVSIWGEGPGVLAGCKLQNQRKTELDEIQTKYSVIDASNEMTVCPLSFIGDFS